jgi:hypothetical protein
MNSKQQKILRDNKYVFISQLIFYNETLDSLKENPQTKQTRDTKYDCILYKIFYRACLTCDIDSVELFHKKLTEFHLDLMEYSQERLSDGKYLEFCNDNKDEFDERIKCIKYIKKIKSLGVTSIV